MEILIRGFYINLLGSYATNITGIDAPLLKARTTFGKEDWKGLVEAISLKKLV